MKSFKDYVNYRSKMSVLEMAAEPIVIKDAKGKERKIVEVRKTPIFMDQDDIDYLKNFPPVLWVQALQKRYGELLYKVHKIREQGGEFNDSEVSVIVNYKKGSSKNVLEFKIKNAKINELYDRLSGDTDDDTYSTLSLRGPDGKLDPDIRQKYLKGRTRSEKGNVLGPYAFSFLGYDVKNVRSKTGKEKQIRHSKGWTLDDSSIQRAVQRWLGSIEDGWYDSEISDDTNFAEIEYQNGKKKKLPVEQKKTWVAGRDFFVIKGNVKIIESWVPIVFPTKMVSSRDYERHDLLSNVSKLLSSDVEKSQLEEYMQIIDINSTNLIDQNKLNEILQKINKIENLKKETEETEESENKEKSSKNSKTRKLNIELAKLEKIKIVASYIRNYRKRFEGYFKEEVAKVQDESEKSKRRAVEMALGRFLSDVVRVVEKSKKRTRRNAERYDIHQWNVNHYNPNEKEKLISLGTMHPNYQQREKTYEGIRLILGEENFQPFVNHIINDLQIRNPIKEGIIRKLQESSDEKKFSVHGIFLKSVKEAIGENIDDVLEDALENYTNRIGEGTMLDYARQYKVQVLENKKNLKEFLNDKTVRRTIKRVNARAKVIGELYCNMLIQLYERFLENKYNRTVRPENPLELQKPNASFEDVLNHIFNNRTNPEIMAQLASRTSHSIDVLEEIQAIGRPFVGFIKTEIKTDDSKEVNSTENQKETNKNIFTSLTNKLFARLGSLFGIGKKPTTGQPTGQTGQPTGQTGQPTGQQPTQTKSWLGLPNRNKQQTEPRSSWLGLPNKKQK